MSKIEVNFNNLSEYERKRLLDLVEKSNKEIRLSEIKNGDTFKIGDVEFIKFSDIDGVTTAVTKDIIFKSRFGDNNNLLESEVFEKLNTDFLPKIATAIGSENICNITTDLTTLDGLKTYPQMTSKVSLPTLDFYRANVEIFDKYKVNEYWWLATPDSAQPHTNENTVICVSPSGDISFNCGSCDDIGVRPFLRFISSIFVSSEG